MQLAALLVNKQCDGNAPGTLARNTPVRAIVEHAFDTRLAPFRVPADIFNCGLGTGQQTIFIHGDKPLRCGAINQWGFGAPAVGVTVNKLAAAHQPFMLAQNLQN